MRHKSIHALPTGARWRHRLPREAASRPRPGRRAGTFQRARPSMEPDADLGPLAPIVCRQRRPETRSSVAPAPISTQTPRHRHSWGQRQSALRGQRAKAWTRGPGLPKRSLFDRAAQRHSAPCATACAASGRRRRSFSVALAHDSGRTPPHRRPSRRRQSDGRQLAGGATRSADHPGASARQSTRTPPLALDQNGNGQREISPTPARHQPRPRTSSPLCAAGPLRRRSLRPHLARYGQRRRR